jgi:hypothetical protein
MRNCMIINMYAFGSPLYSSNTFFPGVLTKRFVGFATPVLSHSFAHLATILARMPRFTAEAS